MAEQRLTNGRKGDRDAHGRFLPGCKPGPGNPYANRVAKLREAGWKSVKPSEIKHVFRKLLLLALQGDVSAARLLLDRLLGPCVEADLIERIDKLEAVLKDR